MTELAADRARQKQVEKMTLTENRFDIAAENVQDEKIAEKMPGIFMQQRGRQELPGMCRLNSVFAEHQIVAHKSRFERVEKKLSDERGDIQSNEREQRDRFALLPRICK